MAKQGVYDRFTMAIDGAPATPVAAGLIIAASTVNAGNGELCIAGTVNILGVTIETTDANGYAGVRLEGIVNVTCGANVTSGQRVRSDAAGKAVPFTPAAAGAGTLKGTLGIAMSTALSGNSVEVLIDRSNMFE